MTYPLTVETMPVGLVVFLIIMVVLMIFSLYMFHITNKARKEGKKKVKDLKAQGMLSIAFLPHVYGLPIPENTNCEIRTYADRMEFHGGNADINLNRNKIVNVAMATDVDIQKQAVSSTGGAILGYAALGPLGAAIGGRVKNRTVRTATTYLIISYRDGESFKHIGFEVGPAINKAQELVNEFNKLNQNTVTKIDL